jgi:choline dehydrogenase-like flavoprotein
MTVRAADVVVIGSGPGGSTLAHAMAERGATVVVVEQGDMLHPDPNRPDVPSISMLDVPGGADRHVVGGPSKYYGAALYRLRERDFEAADTETGESPAWPIRYWDLEQFYAAGERLYGVRGSPEGDPSEPPRSGPYPHGPVLHEPYIAAVVARIRRQGVSVSYLPKAVDAGPGGRCILCGHCDGYYCQRDAKMDAEIAALRPAMATGRVRLLTRTRCLRILTSPDGRRASGVLLQRNGQTFTVQAGTVAVAAGIAQTPVLLRRSASAAHPDGIGNHTGCVGRYLAGHMAGFLFALEGPRRLPPLHQKTFAINQFCAAPPDWPYPLGVIQASGRLPLWRYVPAPVAPAVRFLAERSLTCILMSEAVPSRESGFTFSGEAIVRTQQPGLNRKTFLRLRRTALDIFKAAGFRVVVARRKPAQVWHPVGTARFGEDPATSVLDPECRLHGMTNLYVLDSCVLPSAGAVNTTLTVIALSLRAAAAIAGPTVDLRDPVAA